MATLISIREMEMNYFKALFSSCPVFNFKNRNVILAKTLNIVNSLFKIQLVILVPILVLDYQYHVRM